MGLGEEGKEENALDDLPFARNRDYGENRLWQGN